MHDTLGGALHEFAAHHLGAAQKAIGRALEHPHRSVHEARKAIRRCRAVIALVAKAVGADLDDLDASIRALGKRLSRLRDAHVVMEIAHAQERESGDAGTLHAAWSAIHDALKSRRDALLARTLGEDPGFEGFQRRIGRLRRKLASHAWSEADTSAVAAGLGRSAERVRRASAKMEKHPTRISKHRLRRRVRRMRMQLECLADLSQHAKSLPAARAAAEVLAGVDEDCCLKALTKRADELGKELDLQMLHGVLIRNMGLPWRRTALVALRRQLRPEKA